MISTAETRHRLSGNETAMKTATARSLHLTFLAAGALTFNGCTHELDDVGLDEHDFRQADQTDVQCIGPEGPVHPEFTMADINEVLGHWVPLYSQDPNLLFTGSWTNWYHEPMKQGLAKLAIMRGILDAFNLWDMYLGNLPPVPCPANAAETRTIDGTCNDLDNPLMGSRGIRFGRNVPPFLGIDPDTGLPIKNPAAQFDPDMLMEPNPRDVSRRVFKRTNFKPVPFLNMLAAAWVQFQVHDWFDHGDNHPTDFYEIPLDADDDLRAKFGVDKLIVKKTAADPTRTPLDEMLLPPTFRNDVTHWWDASQLYGSDLETASRLRSFEGGQLKMDEHGLLPKSADGFEDTGMRRNWWLGLGLLHNLFSLEHNMIAEMLVAEHPELCEGQSDAVCDQIIYDKARMVNAALITKIHTVEWTPAILPNPTLEVGMNANWHGLQHFMDPAEVPPKEFVPPAAHSVLYGVAGGPRDLKTNPSTGEPVPFTITEEFVSVYRMHSLLPDRIRVLSLTSNGAKNYRTENTRNADARAIEEEHGLPDLLYSFGVSHPGALVPQNFPGFLQELEIPFLGPLDMGTVDILRDRERGIPRYNDFREQLRLKRVGSFEELTGDKKIIKQLELAYGTDEGAIDRLDAVVGFMVEATRPTCYGFGETLFQVFTVIATRRIQADRFYTDDFTPEVYTQAGMNWIQANGMKSVLLRHFPELESTGLSDVNNAFFPWE
jgi:hypothetical protein